jgi:UDP-N-acetylmuramoyl-L-alanyl-D-glutamate--2,6-diaminopimelate ligase
MLRETPRKRIGNLRLAVLNKDDRSYDYLKRVSPPDFLTYSRINEAHFWADGITSTTSDLAFTLHTETKQLAVHVPIAGIYNVSNTLAALAPVTSLGVPLEQAVKDLESFEGIPGRMQRIDLGQDFTAIVDFAHTPNGLENALVTARAMTKGRVIAVYGSAGLRDREKRRMMPAVSIQLADITILTAEDPRTEPLEGILEEMAQSAIKAGGVEGVNFFRITDRGDALRKALSLTQPGDLVIACGKGHEQSMCFGTEEYHWDDRTAMQAALAEHLGIEGTQMPWLPTSSTPKPA